jgi:dTDP-4-dehydrorhamnose 3,5-epimerase
VNFIQTELPGVILVEPTVHRDDRGFFFESYQADRYTAGGITSTFVQDNNSHSSRGTLRGLHAQTNCPQDKLIRVLQGEIFDIAVDVRRGSPTFAKSYSVTLSAENFRQLFVPVGFIHGFLVTSEFAEIEYKCSDNYEPRGELSVIWNDPEIGIGWPVENPTLSEKDAKALRLREIDPSLLPSY